MLHSYNVTLLQYYTLKKCDQQQPTNNHNVDTRDPVGFNNNQCYAVLKGVIGYSAISVT